MSSSGMLFEKAIAALIDLQIHCFFLLCYRRHVHVPCIVSPERVACTLLFLWASVPPCTKERERERLPKSSDQYGIQIERML
jgi:hypothetical protein